MDCRTALRSVRNDGGVCAVDFFSYLGSEDR